VTKTMKGELAFWLNQFAFQGILFSAGGNDFIDAARDPSPGSGLLNDMGQHAGPATVDDCIRRGAVSALEGFMELNFETIYQAIRRSSLNSATPIFVNGYETPVPRNAPAATFPRKVGPWLYEALTKNNIDPGLWQGVTDHIFAKLRETLEKWPNGRTSVHLVGPTNSLTPAQAGSNGGSGDWANEIHPNPAGWRKLANVWASLLPVA
jgi:lysophospholipase L1-like esterase